MSEFCRDTVEDDVLSVRRDVEPSQAALVAETCDLPSLALDEIEQPEVQRFRVWPVHEMRLVQEAIAARADPQVFPRPGLADHEREIVLRAIEPHGLQRRARLSRGGRGSGKRSRIHDEVAVRRPGRIGRQHRTTRRRGVPPSTGMANRPVPPASRPAAAIQRPSGDQSGAPWISRAAARVCEPWPSWFMTARCRRPASLTTTATRLPSGAGAGVSTRCPSAPLVISNASALKPHTRSPVPRADRKNNNGDSARRAYRGASARSV